MEAFLSAILSLVLKLVKDFLRDGKESNLLLEFWRLLGRHVLRPVFNLYYISSSEKSSSIFLWEPYLNSFQQTVKVFFRVVFGVPVWLVPSWEAQPNSGLSIGQVVCLMAATFFGDRITD
jgi:hypothetical protein